MVLGNDHVLSSALREMNADDRDALTPARLRQHLVQQWPNVPAEVLAQNAPRQLYLTPAQVERLQAAADSVVALREPVLRELVELLTGTRRYDAGTIRRLAELKAQAIALRQGGADRAREILTAEQWSQLPAPMRTVGTELLLSPRTEFSSGDAY